MPIDTNDAVAENDRAALRAAEGIPTAMVIAGEATLQEMMNLIAHSRGVVSVDTGVAHIAAQLRKPLVVMHTCVGRAWWLPGQYDSDASIAVFECDAICAAGHIGKEYPDCINEINVEDIARRCAALTEVP